MFFHLSRKSLKLNVKVKLNQLVKNKEAVKFVMADINCGLKVVFKDGNNVFVSDCNNLRDELSVFQKCFFEFLFFAFHYLVFDINIIYFFMI